MGNKTIIVFVFAMLTTFMPTKGRNHTRHLPLVISQGNTSGVSIFEAYDESKSMKQRFERLDAFALYLKEAPSFRAYVISYGGRRSCREEALKRAQFAQEYLYKVKGIDQELITTLDGGYLDQWAVYLWVGGRGDSPPRPLPTVDRSKVHIIRNCKLKTPRRKAHGS
jgi:hypothetical protein